MQLHSPRRALRRSQGGGPLCCFFIIACVALACSDEPASDAGSPLVSQVDSAPPQLGKLRNRHDSLAVERDRKAREAFDRWAPLLTSGESDQARELCEGWLGQPDRGHHAEAHKCLANVAIATSRVSTRRDSKPGTSSLRAPVSRFAVDTAVEHYAAAIAASPFDPDAHVGRVDVLIVSGRYREANVALDESLAAFSSRALLDNWFKLLGRFQQMGAMNQGLAFLQIIEKYHPLDHRVVSNLGAYHAMTGDTEQALAYSERAVAINPDDPINKWNLARIYDRQDRLDEADRQYREALALFGDEDPRANCDYVEFVATRLEDNDRACEFAKSRCENLYKRNCTEDKNAGSGRADSTSG